MKIGLVPMSAKPYHAGHHMLVEFASVTEMAEEIREVELPVNDRVLVFVSFSSRGTRKIKDPDDPRTVKQGARKIEVPKPGKTAVFGSDMRYIWNQLLKPNLKLPSKASIISPDDGASSSPVRNIHTVCEALHQAYQNGEETFVVPFSGETARVQDTIINIYSDDADIVQNYSDQFMTGKYGELWKNVQAPSIRGVGVPRTSTIQISGTQMRKFLCNGDLESFASMLPPLPDAVKMEIAQILSDSASCGLPREKRLQTESLLRRFVRNLMLESFLRRQG